jgi:restriction system protein
MARAGAQPTSLPLTKAPSQPECPQCGKPMVRRTARRGPTAGSQFWGCSSYPDCRGIRAA